MTTNRRCNRDALFEMPQFPWMIIDEWKWMNLNEYDIIEYEFDEFEWIWIQWKELKEIGDWWY